ncbi:GTP-binding protein 2 [Leucoagaricus sp. SymC.cos]|nr:GTP-binding protein 2 [Leucoagaricus sp. SymC.cos]
MFGEYESESPRVPSPWDSLISSPRSLSPSKLTCQSNASLSTDTLSTSISPRHLSPSPLLLPRLVPENDSGNVEYKLQLLNPSPARFARLVTQLKWRLLEGGGQAYYELGVADSGDLVGLGREELEASLDTLEMMAGEIGASVIVVKEIEVPAELAAHYEEDSHNNGQFNSCGDARGKRSRRKERGLVGLYLDDADSTSIPASTNVETEDDLGVNDDHQYEDMQINIALQKSPSSHDAMADLTDAMAMFSMDLELDSGAVEGTDISEIDDDRLALPPPQYAIDLEISSVYKPRPMRKRFHHIHPGHQHPHANGQGRSNGKRGKKVKEKPHVRRAQKDSSSPNGGAPAPSNKALTRRQARDRRREERKQTLLTMAVRGVVEAPNGNVALADATNPSSHPTPTEHAETIQAEAETLVEELEGLHVGVGSSIPMSITSESIATSFTSVNTDSTITTTTAGVSTTVNATHITSESHVIVAKGDVRMDDDEEVLVAPVVVPRLTEPEDGKADTKLIVEVLVVRKMSMEEGFLDFEGFSFV